MPFEPKDVIAALAVLLTVYNLWRSSWKDRQTTDEGLRARFDTEMKAVRATIDALEKSWRLEFQSHHDAFIRLEVQVNPLVQAIQRRVGDLLHQPHRDAREVDALIERFQEDPEALTDLELNRLIHLIWQRYERIRNSSSPEDQTKALAASLYLAVLDAQKATRKLLREQAARDRLEHQHHEELMRLLQEARPATPQESGWTRFWTSLTNFLRGSN